ncbi:NADP-dependent oxidoreductase [Goodfellowiella coeruleoviolacea]|nr:NADP-dependent oxidoreductase [Goodfellowiella coeruleoviolacea]
MRVARQEKYGPDQELEIVEVDVPGVLPGEVLVRVRAAGVNPVDWKTRAGGGIAGLLGDGPLVPGWDVSGVVEEVGPGVTRFAVGDEVYGMPRFPGRANAYAEYVSAPARHLVRKPAAIDHVRAAAVPLAGLTAWQALVDTAEIAAGQRVLILAAAGGVGHLAVQIAKARGAHVIGTASAGKHGFLRELGVDEVVDYTTTDVADVVRDADVVLDLLGGEHTNRVLPTLRPGGLLITTPTPPAPEAEQAAAAAGVRLTWVLVEPDHHALDQLSELIERGRVRVEVDGTWPLAQAGQAHKIGSAGHTRGKIVLEVA